MPDNPLPDAKNDAATEPAEFNFSTPPAETSRIRRRSLKSKQPGLIKPAAVTIPPTARELEHEAPPLSAEEVTKPVARQPEVRETVVAAKTEPAAKPAQTNVAPPRTTPSVSPTNAAAKTAANGATSTTTSATSRTAGAATSPHGTRPATLYYSSSPRKETPAAAAPTTASSSSATRPTTASPMKTIPTSGAAPSSSTGASSTARPAGSTASTPSSSSTTRPVSSSTSSAAATPVSASVTRPTTASSSTARPSTTTDYRANIERQSREQKSVGSLLSYIVYTFLAIFVLTAALAGYGGYVLSKRITEQSVTVNDLDSRYAAANKDLNAKLATTQDTLAQAQAQLARQQDLIVKQQDQINRLITATNDNTKAITNERQLRTQETTALRGRVRDLEKNEPAPAANR